MNGTTKEQIIMLISDVFGLVAIVSILLAILCAFNGWVFDFELSEEYM